MGGLCNKSSLSRSGAGGFEKDNEVFELTGCFACICKGAMRASDWGSE